MNLNRVNVAAAHKKSAGAGSSVSCRARAEEGYADPCRREGVGDGGMLPQVERTPTPRLAACSTPHLGEIKIEKEINAHMHTRQRTHDRIHPFSYAHPQQASTIQFQSPNAAAHTHTHTRSYRSIGRFLEVL
jgi:hypothetical protein